MSRIVLAAALAVALVPAAHGALPIVADLLGAPAPFEEVAPPWDFSAPASQVVLHALVHEPGTGSPTTVFSLEDAAGALVLYVVAQEGALHVSDGYEVDGATPRPLLVVPRAIGEAWTRVDVRVEGSTFVLRLDEAHEVVGRTFAAATAVRVGDAALLPHGPGHDASRVRISHVRAFPDGAAVAGFGTSLQETGWIAEGTPGGAAAQAEAEGFLGVGRLAVEAGRAPVAREVAYAHRALPPHEGAYLAQAWVRPHAASALQPGGVPDHQAVLAGLAGPLDAPEVRWAVVAAQAGARHDAWALYLVGPDGSRTQVSPAWTPSDALWQGVTVGVDEDADEVVVQVDGAASALRFLFPGLGTSERLAMGDVWLDHALWTGGGRAYYDEAALVAR